jgi:hypothetical protein
MVPESGKQDDESLTPEIRRKIESQFDQTANQTGRLAATFMHYAVRALVVVLLLLGVAFSYDYIQLRRNQNAFGSVTISRFYAVTLKNKKTDFSYGEPQVQACVNSIFPHYGYYPCWYLRRHNVQQINI